ncbi:VWA domain-containing protein [Cronbergia sp. UHCC 0137]|uniref:vWA domain-containing protein n=1 Tax=Cronbergia sp. UHCC 0137 TaxID=3110239 RepID=UPI002B20B9A0|nr:VWA domain-containing protein [Cronbergia sp. UHCC 0137]MEA5616369.1 VWA domain-containing protein [Cronbergia sp. UHCC 0137]
MLENRDYTLIIDQSSSMATPDQKGGMSRWLALQESTFALACKCEEFDLDGITVYLFSRKFQRFDYVTSAKVAQIFSENTPGDTTNLCGVLQDAINNYFKRKADGKTKPKGEVILVVTDGIPCDRQSVFNMIIDATHRIDNDKELRIAIIQVGADSQATKFLKALDDQLQSVGAKFDICDTITLDELEQMSLTDVLLKVIDN